MKQLFERKKKKTTKIFNTWLFEIIQKKELNISDTQAIGHLG